MHLTNSAINEFNELSRQLIKFINDNCNPHTTIIITTDSAELLSGELSVYTKEFIND